MKKMTRKCAVSCQVVVRQFTDSIFSNYEFGLINPLKLFQTGYDWLYGFGSIPFGTTAANWLHGPLALGLRQLGELTN
jgi:hypothetical protein